MGRKPKLYIPLTVTFYDDDRIIEAGDGPAHLYLAMALKCKAQGSDGRLMENQISRLHRPQWRRELAKLAALRLVVQDEVTGEWCIAAWFGHNDPIEVIDRRRAADNARKQAENAARREAISDRNPTGIPTDSAPKGREGKEREGKEGKPGALHRFTDDGDGACATCHLPVASRYHIRAVEAS